MTDEEKAALCDTIAMLGDWAWREQRNVNDTLTLGDARPMWFGAPSSDS